MPKIDPPDAREYRRPEPGTQPAYLYPAYKSSVTRAPTKALVFLPHTLSETTGPVFGHSTVSPGDDDMTLANGGEAIGARIIVGGRVLDEDGKPVANTLLEIWQANAGGRYRHRNDGPHSPLDPHFNGCARVVTDADGRYRFKTIKPGPYPWGNHENAWRPAHIHFSLLGPAFVTRQVTQMYFPGDPLLPFDPIYNSIPDENARVLLISRFDWDTTVPNYATGFRFDIVLRGRNSTPMEANGGMT
jgi:protocatechuate 3,4-dioxygenase beta subunit